MYSSSPQKNSQYLLSYFTKKKKINTIHKYSCYIWITYVHLIEVDVDVNKITKFMPQEYFPRTYSCTSFIRKLPVNSPRAKSKYISFQISLLPPKSWCVLIYKEILVITLVSYFCGFVIAKWLIYQLSKECETRGGHFPFFNNLRAAEYRVRLNNLR
jgi:hypothetical protein